MTGGSQRWAEPRDDALARRLVAAALGDGSDIVDEALARRAEEEKVDSLLGARVAEGLEATPEAAAFLHSAHRDGVARDLAAEASLIPVLEALHQRNVEPLAIKGLALRHTVYGAGERWMADVDLLVRPGHWRAFTDAIQSVGGRIIRPGERPLTDRLFHEIHAVVPPGFLVDGHRALHQSPLFPIATEDLFAASKAAPVSAGPLRMPSLEDQLMILATHAAKDGYFVPLRDVVDSLTLVAAGADAPRIAERAGQWHCRRAVALWLRILQRFDLPREPWEETVKMLDPRGTTATWAESFPQRFVGTPRRHAWTVKGRLAGIQDSFWRGGVFLGIGGLLYAFDAGLRPLARGLRRISGGRSGLGLSLVSWPGF